MSDRVYSLFIDETGDTDEPGNSAVVGLLLEGIVPPESDASIRSAIQNGCVDLAWAIHAASLNTPAGFLNDRTRKRPVVHARLESAARTLQNARPQFRKVDLESWSSVARMGVDDALRSDLNRLAAATEQGRNATGDALASLSARLGRPVTLVATVCGPGSCLATVEELVADGYVVALVRTFRTVAELVAREDGHTVVHLYVLERHVQRARDRGRVMIGPSFALRLANHAVRRARLAKQVSFGGKPYVTEWTERTSAMLVLADHAANRFRHALTRSRADDLPAFLARVRAEVKVGAEYPSGPAEHGLAHLDRTDRDAPPWARRLPASRDG